MELKNIKKDYYINKTNTVKVLKGVDIKFRRHEFVSILGPSGCGKTTLLNIIGGLDVADEGEIVINGVSTREYSQSDWDDYRNKRIGFVFQSYNLIPHLNVVSNVEMPLVLAGADKAECRKRAEDALKTVGLETQTKKKPSQLSGGQMQRVAIARALVTNPDIILADEPTGALDNESSEQVMALLEKVSEDRLVIMVTHNNLLAERYSTRIISLAGGVVSDDTNPYDGVEKEKTVSAPKNARPKKSGEKKSHLSFLTATKLSARNLVSKRVRTALTSFAGSIGIIGIILVLAFSTGVNAYVGRMEESSLSLYPLSIERTNLSLTSIMALLTQQNSEREEFPDSTDIYTDEVLGNVISNVGNLISANDLASFKRYLDENFDEKLGYVKYEYGVSLNVYADDPKSTTSYMKIEPILDAMEGAMQKFMPSGSSALVDSLKPYAGLISGWDELISNRTLLNDQYELIGDSAWPKTEMYKDENGDWIAEIVIAVDSRNQISDYTQFMLGLKSEADLNEAFTNPDSFSKVTYPVDSLIGKEYKILAGCDYYDYDEDTGKWSAQDSATKDAEFVDSRYTAKAKIVGVVRPRQGSAGTSINGVIGYEASLMKFMINYAAQSEAVKAQQKVSHFDITDSDNNYLTDDEMETLLASMGVADEDNPIAINIYAHSFETKDEIIDFIENYNAENDGNTIKYTDTLSTLMTYVNTLSGTITKVLIGFTSVSLIVSSIMIAVIIYTSVLERRKEVGILRSIGARKSDISVIFMSESGMLGLLSGLIGVLIGWLITIPVNLLLKNAVGIGNLAIVEWSHMLIMIAISFVLSVVSGVVPAFIGAKLDPAVALRNE